MIDATSFTEDELRRFWTRVDFHSPGGCWLWTGGTFWDGCGCKTMGRKSWRTHRLAWVLLIGPIPGGKQLDHKCHNRSVGCPRGPECPHRRCVNPAHLRVVTNQQNVIAGPRSVYARTGRCAKGHLATHRDTNGKLYCAPCRNARRRERWLALYGGCPLCGSPLSGPKVRHCRRCRFK